MKANLAVGVPAAPCRAALQRFRGRAAPSANAVDVFLICFVGGKFICTFVVFLLFAEAPGPDSAKINKQSYCIDYSVSPPYSLYV